MVLKFYIIFSSILLSSNEKTQNYKVVDLIEVYNLHIKIIFIRHRIEGFSIFLNLSLITRETILSRDETQISKNRKPFNTMSDEDNFYM